jgi:glycine hydroxymethyltransferase
MLMVLWYVQWPQALNKHLHEVDPELYDIIEKEKNRQWKVPAHVSC